MPDTYKYRSGNGPIKLLMTKLFALIIILSTCVIHHASSYLVIIDEHTPANTIIFNASVNKLGSERHYKINTDKNGGYVHRLFHINPKNGQIKLRKQLKCDGNEYPNLFTFYTDSVSNHLRTVNYYGLPVRIFINGMNCNDDGNNRETYSHYENEDEDDSSIMPSFLRRKRNLDEDVNEDDNAESIDMEQRVFRVNNFHHSLRDYPFIFPHNESHTDYKNFQEGDILFDSVENNFRRHLILNRKRRFVIKNEDRFHKKISDAKQWISETYASYAIHSTDKFDKICLKKSQVINNLNAFLPRTIQQHCKATFLDVRDERFKIERQNGDMVASRDFCIYEPSWSVTIIFSTKCTKPEILDAEHRLKIMYHHQELNDTDIAKRIKRELKNQNPSFEQQHYIATVLEEQLPGVRVTTVQARDPEDSPVVYSMISPSDSRSQTMFKIDSKSGIVTTSATLDRELISMHYFRVIATDDSYPPRTGTAILQINVLDCNDHPPKFETEQFDTTVSEGVSVGTTVLTLRATDLDSGKNSEIEYHIDSVSGGGLTTAEQDAQTFKIDGRTGIITTRSQLDRETSEVYTLIVTANDLASPISERKTATATVVIRIADENDHYPQFSERHYTVDVSEDDSNGNNVIAHIKATDADKGNNAAIRYSIVGGNPKSEFAIDSMSGEVTLTKPLDYETMKSYRLVVRAQDGGTPPKTNTTTLSVNVIDANDNAPRFYSSQIQETVLESVSVGHNIVRVQAYDADEGANSEITYSISDRDGNFPFAVDSRTGQIHTTKPLDREEKHRYSFQVVAVDGGVPPKSGSTTIQITVQDVNDNNPIFNPKYYEAIISEDQKPGTPVTSVSATDPDEDSRLHYDIKSGNLRNRFSISTQNGLGLITIAQPLDYKLEKRFILTVTATDSGGKIDTATVNINITDANNFPPVFENAPYSASVLEDAPIGTTVLIVTATDADVGINAQITYTMSNDETSAGMSAIETFSINPQTGAITTKTPLDRETTSGYSLTVTAKDGGNPSHSETTIVEISVVDVNDNKPEFNAPIYHSTISEDALIGTSVIQVSASDRDEEDNRLIKYMLSDKDVKDGSFIIDSSSGVIRTNRGLDRETIAVYHLNVIAFDKGSPPLSSTVEVQVKLDDVNDSPPTFPSDRMKFYIKENSPIGSTVGLIKAEDPDEGINAEVHYAILSGQDASSFHLITKPGVNGARIITNVDLDYESSQKRFELVIRASSPPLRNDVHVEILVTDANDNQPVLKDFHVIFNNFRDHFPSGIIGRVPAFDADVNDNLTYRILSGNNANLIRLNSNTGQITLSPQLNTNVPKSATMEVSVSDGINEIKASMHLIVRLVSDDMLFNSVTIRLNEMTAEAFLSPLLNYFLDGLAAVIPCPRENIYMFSIQEDTDVVARVLNISFAARRPDVAHEEFYSTQYLQERVYLNRAILARLANVEVLPFDDNLCVREPCLNFEQCLTVSKFGNATDFTHSDTVLFRSIQPVNTFACNCPEGFTGGTEAYLCDTEVNLCYSDPCQNGGTCKQKENGYTCLCKNEFTGNNCEKKLKAAPTCLNEICESGYSCSNASPYSDSFNLPFTPTCELKARSFSSNSFLTFDSLKQRHRFNIKLKFATINDNGLLLYNGRYNDLHDFIALELIDGRATFSFSLGDKIQKVFVTRKNKLSDGEWHTVEIIYFNRTATLVIDECDVALALSENLGEKWSCANQTTLELDKKCSLFAENCHRLLDLTGPLQIGGLPRIPAHFQIQSQDYVGCISDLEIDYKFIDMNSFVADNGTISGCPEKKSLCSTNSPCFNGATCHDGWNAFTCKCRDNYTGNVCQENVESSWRFAGNGYVSFNAIVKHIQLPWLNALSVRTRQRDAFLMQIVVDQNSSAIISLKNGVLYYTFDSESMYLPGSFLSDGDWHRIEIKWLGADISLSVDYGQRETLLPTMKKVQGLYAGIVVIGSPDKSIGNIQEYDSLDGCIQDIRIGTHQSIIDRPTRKENVQKGCPSHAECPENCPIHSECVLSWDEAHCKCNSGYVGKDCVPICTVGPCADAGICRVENNLKKGYFCECNSTIYSGEYCEIQEQKPCPGGWWGEKSCGPCKCDVKRGYHPDCDKQNGQCRCRDNHYQPVNETACIPCDCYYEGSISGSCNKLTGQCECREGVIGRRCDSCSNSYAEVTAHGCEVVYDGCPKSFSAGVWWPRTSFGQSSIENCPPKARGKGLRTCDETSGGWGIPNMFNCTSDLFWDLRRQLSSMEQGELQLNTFVSVKMAADLQHATSTIGGSKNKKANDDKFKKFSLENSFMSRNRMRSNEIDIETYIDTEHLLKHEQLYGADLLVTEGILHELIGYEVMQSGLDLSHSQDKDYIRNLVESASIILDEKYTNEWKRLKELTTRGPNDLIDAFNKYLVVLARSQHDTYTTPFEIVHNNMALGLDIVTAESLFGYEPQLLNKNRNGKANQYTTESVIIPDTSAFLQHSSKQRIPTISFPKYNNYMQDKTKFDRYSKVLVPLDMLGILPPEKGEVSYAIKNYRAIIGYTQYKDIGELFPMVFDDTVTRRYGVDVEIATSVLSLTILVPSLGNDDKQMERIKNIDQHSENRIDENFPPENMKYPDDIKIIVHDMTDHDDAGREMKIHVNGDDIFNPNFDSAEDVVIGKLNHEDESQSKKLIKRDIVNRDSNSDVETIEDKITYRSLGSPHLSQPIRVQMWLNIEKLRFSSRLNPQCVRWHTFYNQWTRIGCHTEMPDYEKVQEDESGLILINCTCTHVSSYAVLIDVIDPEDIPEPSLLVQITSLSAFVVSLPILFCVIIALALLRGLQTNSNTIHQNLVFCIFVAELLFFVAWQARRSLVENDFPCKLIAIGLHYAWLAAFAWTTVDCIHLYRMLTEMRDINHGPMGFYFTVGYGAPALLVGLSVGVRVHEYGNNMFCWLSVYESVIWWLVAPIVSMCIVNLMVLFISVKAAFTLKDHVLGFGNLRTLLWLSVVSLPLMGIMWVLSILSASESVEIYNLALSACVLVHAIFSIIGYCIINKRVRENLHNTFMRCMGKKVPLLDSSLAVSSSNSGNRTPGFNGTYETSRRNIGISASSTTSRSTAKTSSSPYRSDGQLRNTSTSTSNYNSDVPSFMKNYEGKKKRRHRKDSDSGSETDGRSMELASSHSSDDDESRAGKSSTTNSHHRTKGVVAVPSYLPNITEHVATTPPELHVVQSPQLFPNSKGSINGRWSSQAPESFLPTPNIGRWSQETGSDNEIHSHKTSSPNPLPNPDITDTSYLQQHQNKMNLPPSILENIHENYIPPADPVIYSAELYNKEHYENYHTDYQTNTLPYHPNDKEFPNSYTVGHMRIGGYPNDNGFLYEKSRTLGYLGSKTSSPYMSKERIDGYSPQSFSTFKSNGNGNTNIYGNMTNTQSVQSLIRNDYQRQTDYHSDRNSEGSDKNNPYNFPYTAEEDHTGMRQHMQAHYVNDINNPSPINMSRMSSRHGSRSGSPPMPHLPHVSQLSGINDSSERSTDAETRV